MRKDVQAPTTPLSFLRPLAILLAGAVALVALAACEEDITDPRLVDSPYTIYGIVNPKADTQQVRVIPVSKTPIGSALPEPLDVDVRFVDLVSGQSYPARDSIVTFFQRRYGHVFWSDFRPEFDRAYRIEVTGTDGITTHARTQIPPPAEIEMLNPATRFDSGQREYIPLQPVAVHGEQARLHRLEAVYNVEAQNIGRGFHRISYTSAASPVGGGWTAVLDLVSDYQQIYADWREVYRQNEVELRRQGVECCRIEFYGLDVEAEIVDTAWTPPGGVFSPELLIQPGTMDNVENGFGFVGAGFVESAEIRLNRCFQYWAGYVFADDPCTPEQYCTYRNQCSGE